MNNAKIKKALLLAIGGVFVWWAWKSPAQDATEATASLQMPYAVTQVLELEQAKIGDLTVVAYIKSSGTSYNLNASQIVFLRQQGVSDGVITAMLTQPRMGASIVIQLKNPTRRRNTRTATTTAPAIVSQPPVTYVQTAPASTMVIPTIIHLRITFGWPHFWFPWSYGGHGPAADGIGVGAGTGGPGSVGMEEVVGTEVGADMEDGVVAGGGGGWHR